MILQARNWLFIHTNNMETWLLAYIGRKRVTERAC